MKTKKANAKSAPKAPPPVDQIATISGGADPGNNIVYALRAGRMFWISPHSENPVWAELMFPWPPPANEANVATTVSGKEEWK